jgi:SAM-dependent methyltransferase
LTYEEQVDTWVQRAQREAKTLGDLVKKLPGVYPTTVVESLKRLGASIPVGDSELLLSLPGPRPHPVESDWRFHPDSHEYLVSTLEPKLAAEVLLLGCPSLVAAVSSNVTRVAVVDSNSAWDRHVRSRSVEASWGDVSAATLRWRDEFSVAIVDPPWYPAEFERFLSVAAALVRPGGRILLSWPGAGTRPGLAQDWSNLLQKAQGMGLRYQKSDRLVLRYATPFFEASAMRAADLPILNAWRRADLATFVRDESPTAMPTSASLSRWQAHQWRTLDLRFRTSTHDADDRDPRLVSLIDGDVLPTVSRRDGRREAATVWTGGNRIFRCARPDILKVVAEALSKNVGVSGEVARATGRVSTGIEAEWLVEAENQLRILESLEAAEYHDFHGSPPPTV